MSTKVSKSLAVAVTAFSVLFLGVAAVTTATRTDWKTKATKEFPKATINEQTQKLQELDSQIVFVEKAITDAREFARADVQAIVDKDPAKGREANWETQLAALENQEHKLAEETEIEASKVNAKQDELTRRRDEIVRLRAQYEDLVAQKLAALADVKRLRDLLVQAQGTLDRVVRRQELLQSDAAKMNSYIDSTP
jgi:chromosome segregation ATPase